MTTTTAPQPLTSSSTSPVDVVAQQMADAETLQVASDQTQVDVEAKLVTEVLQNAMNAAESTVAKIVASIGSASSTPAAG